MIAILVGYGSYSCGRYRKRASGRNDAEMDCRTERKKPLRSRETDGRDFLFRYLQYAFLHCRLHAAPCVRIRTLQALLYVADVRLLQLGALCRIDIVRELGVDGGHLRSVV